MNNDSINDSCDSDSSSGKTVRTQSPPHSESKEAVDEEIEVNEINEVVSGFYAESNEEYSYEEAEEESELDTDEEERESSADEMHQSESNSLLTVEVVENNGTVINLILHQDANYLSQLDDPLPKPLFNCENMPYGGHCSFTEEQSETSCSYSYYTTSLESSIILEEDAIEEEGDNEEDDEEEIEDYEILTFLNQAINSESEESE